MDNRVTPIIKQILFDHEISVEDYENYSKDELLIRFHQNQQVKSEANFSEEMFTLAFYKSPMLMTLSEIETGRYIEINDEYTNVTGFTKEDVVGKTAIEIGFISSKQRELLKNEMIKKGFVKDLELKLKKKDGSIFYCSYSGEFLNFGRKKRLLSIAKDITSIKQYEDALIKERALLNTLVDNLPVGVYVKDLDGKKVLANEADCENIGDEKKNIIGKTDLELFPGEIGKKVFNDDMKVLKKGEKIINHEEFIVNKNGSEKWLLTSKVPYSDANQNIDGLVGIGIDISEKKKADQELKKYREELEALVEDRTRELKKVNLSLEEEISKSNIAKREVLELLEREVELNKMKSRFISTTSHEFKTPLTTILSSADLLAIFLRKNDTIKIEKHIERIRKTVGYLDSLINDVLLLNRTETGKIKFSPEEKIVVDIINGVINNNRENLVENSKIIFNKDINEQKKYIVDEQLIEIMLTNLISNSIKYSPNGGDIEIHLFENEKYLNLEIADNGIGIIDNDLKYIFDQFYRGSNSDLVAGSGLGLSIVKKAVELHGGEIKVLSKINFGTKFSITIPLEVVNWQEF